MEQAQFDALFPPKGAQPLPKAGAQPDLIGKIKGSLTAEPPAGQRHGYFQFGPDLGPAVRGLGRFMLPGSWEDVGGLAATGLIPGGGAAKALTRVGAAAGAGGAIAAAKGKDPGEAALEQGAGSAIGHVVGAAAQPIVRTAGAALAKTTERFGDWVARMVPDLKGSSPKETIRRVFSGEGQSAMSKEYENSIRAALKAGGDPMLEVPALTLLGKPRNMAASDAMLAVDSIERSLTGVTGNKARRKGSLEEMAAIEKAKSQIQFQLAQKVPKESLDAITAADRKYFRFKAIQRLLGRGRENVTETMEARLFDPGKGELLAPQFEKNVRARMGELQKAFDKNEFAELMDISFRGETNPLAISTVGQQPQIGFFGKVPHPKKLPKAPRLIGRPEAAAQAAGDISRVAGTRAAQEVLDEGR